MARTRSSENQITQEQLKRRARNARYRSSKKNDSITPSQSQEIERGIPSQKLTPKLRLVSQSLNESTPVRKEPMAVPLPVMTAPESQMDPTLKWQDLFVMLTKPSSVLLMACIAILISYLVYQGVVFFSAIDPQPISAISSAIVSELVPFLTAACFALAPKLSHRIVAFMMLVTSIIGLGLFMHKSISTQITQSSGYYERISKSRELTLASIDSYTKSLATLPEAYVSKRREISKEISAERENLTKIDREIRHLEISGGESRNTDLNYAVWIRLAAMLLNAYLIHLLFSTFRRGGTRNSINWAIPETQ